MLPNEAVIEYQDIYKRLFKKDISFDAAKEAATKLLNLVLVIEKPYEDENCTQLHSDAK